MPTTFSSTFWSFPFKEGMQNHTFCPLFQTPGVTQLLSRMKGSDFSFTPQDGQTILFILAHRAFGTGWRLANQDHFIIVSELVFHESLPSHFKPLLTTALDLEWREFCLLNSLD